MAEDANVLESVLDDILGLGRKNITREVSIGEHVFILQPVGSEDECVAFDYAEAFLDIPETPNFIDAAGNKSFKPYVGASYVHRVKQSIIARSIYAVNGVFLDRTLNVPDLNGQLVPVNDQMLTIVQTWEEHVLDYFWIEYNRMIKTVADQLGFQLPHQILIEALDKMVSEVIEAQDKLVQQEEDQFDAEKGLSVDEVIAREAEIAAEQDAFSSLQELRDDSPQGVLDGDFEPDAES